MLEILQKYCKNGEYISIYDNYEKSGNFDYGKILAVNKEFCVIYAVSTLGDLEGILVTSTDKIFKIETDNQYDERMKRLMFGKNLPDYDIVFDDDIVNSVLLYAFNNRVVISVELLDSGYTDAVGFVSSVKDDVCKFQILDSDGNEDGYSYMRVSDITEISFDSSKENIVKILHNGAQ